MSRFKLEKQNDQVILIDTQSNKTRTITPDDIDYIIDDDQKLRDDNIIMTYFKMKEDNYKPKTITKKANIVEEYKQAMKDTQRKDRDYLQEFITTFNLSELQLKQLAKMPYIETIKEFGVDQTTKQKMIDSFNKVIESLNDKGITNTETYIKNYLKKTYEDHIRSIVDLIVNEKNYKNHEDYMKVKEAIKSNPINSLNDLYTLGIKRFANIELDMLNKIFGILHNMLVEAVADTNNLFIGTGIINDKFVLDVKYRQGTTNNCFYMFIQVGILNTYKNNVNAIIDMMKNQLLYFNTIERILVLIDNINTLKNAHLTESEIYAFYYQIGTIYNGIRKEILPDDKEGAFSFRTYNQTKPNQNNPSIIMKIDKYARNLNFDKGDEGDNKTSFEKFRQLVSPIIETNIIKFAGKFGGSWSDDTLTRIDNILNVLNQYSYGGSWSDDTLTRIDNILKILNQY